MTNQDVEKSLLPLKLSHDRAEHFITEHLAKAAG